MREIVSNSERDTELAGERFGASVPDGAVVAMYGELGSARRPLCAHGPRHGHRLPRLQPHLHNSYEYLGARELIHFDMYRLASADELWDIGWEDYLARGAVCVVEWSENVEGAFYGDEVRVVFEKTGENSRLIRIEGD